MSFQPKQILKISTWLLLLFCFVANESQAQQNGSIRGQVVDETKNGLEFVAISLLKLPDSTFVEHAETAANGRFQFPAVAPGAYVIKTNYIGYDVAQRSVTIEAGDNENLGVINLSVDSKLLQEVVVEREAPAVQYELDRTVFNITSDVQAMSVNATEVLEQIPMVELDEEGTPSVMGQGLTVLIDGRPSRIYGDNIETVLKLIPSGVIEKVEVITSPSARYTTEEGGIVLNIVTKSKSLIGVSGIATMNATTNNRYSPSLNVNITRKKIGFNNSVSFDFDKEPTESRIYRENRVGDLFFTDQQRTGMDIDKDFSYNGNLFYNFNENNTVGVFFGIGRDTEDEEEALLTRSYNSENEDISSYRRVIDGTENSWQYRGGIDYKRTFENENQVLDLQAYYSTRDDKDIEIFDQESEWEELEHLQHQTSISEDEGFTFQGDYVHPFGENAMLEAGVRAEWETDANEFTPLEFDNELGEYVIDTELLNDYESREKEFTGYLMYRNSFDRLSVQAGARLEKAILKTEQRILNQSYENDFLNLIPTLNLSYRLKNEDNIKFSYSRRARRPWWRQLNPFVDYSNPEDIQSGNPDLDPELINSFEASYGKFINQFNLFGSVFYRHSNNPIQRVSTVDASGITHTTYQNIGTENYYGLETGVSADVVPNWNVRLNIGLRKNEVLGFDRENSQMSFTGRFSTFFPIAAGFRGYAFVRYRGPRAIAQGTMKGMLISDAGIRKSFFNNKANFSVRISDIFNQMQFSRTLEQENFFQTSDYKRQSRYVSFSISYIFGSLRDSGGRGDNDMDQGPGDMGGGMQGGMED